METKNLTLVEVMTETFDTTPCTFWRNQDGEIYMTREDIGQALDYCYPEKAIAKIHSRHADRLDPLSVVVEMVSADGKTYPRYIYSRRGIMEICRWSRKPRANEFMDFAFNISEQYYKNNLVHRDKLFELALQMAQNMMLNTQNGVGANLETELLEMKSLVVGMSEQLHVQHQLQTIDEMIRYDISNNRIRAALRGMIKMYCRQWNIDERACWNWIYKEFQDRFGIDLWRGAGKLKITLINWIDSNGYLPLLATLTVVLLFDTQQYED